MHFREKVCLENFAKPDYLVKNLSYKETQEYCNSLGREAVFEEIWKFGNKKWEQTDFSSLEVAVLNNSGEIVSISGCRRYEPNLLRVAMHLYTLKDYRKSCRNVQFSDKGFFYKHIEYARSLKDIEALFLTVYPYSKKLLNHFKNLAYRRLSVGSQMQYIHDLIPIEKPINFHNVDQYFLYYPLKANFQWPNITPQPLKI